MPVAGPGRIRPLLNVLAPWLVLTALAVWALRPFLTPLAVGSGDARWYTMMLADWATQVRQGSFPVWLGRTAYAFNGAVTPVRVAPLYQHWAGMVDLLTGHALGFLALQNLTIVSLAVAGVCSAYAAMIRISPDDRLLAALCSSLYLLCPGTLGLVSLLDLQMTWAAFPVLPWFFAGLWGAARVTGIRSDWAIAWPLAALWLAHPPTALWASGLAVAYLGLIGLGGPWRDRFARLGRCALFGGLLLAFTAAAQVSVHQPGGSNTAFSTLAQPDRIMRSVSESFPADLLPLAPGADPIQLGYSLWLLLIATVGLSVVLRRRAPALLAGLVLLFLLLLFPLPGATALAWRTAPALVLRITGYWPMQRLYPIAAAGTTLVGFGVLARLGPGGRRRRSILWMLALGCAWSVYQANHICDLAMARRLDADTSARSFLPENRLLTQFAYGQFRDLPPRFSAGGVEPWNEFRLLDPSSLEPLPDPPGPSSVAGTWTWSTAEGPGVNRADSPLRLEPGREYLLEIDFPPEECRGVLQFKGRRLYREYALPLSGGPLAFGSARGADRRIALQVGGLSPDEVAVRFLTTQDRPSPRPWSYRLWVRSPNSPGSHLEALGPPIVTVRSAHPALLLTPIMEVNGYRATVDERPAPVQTLSHGELAVPIPAGVHRVVISYRAPLYLQAAYWTSLGTAVGGGLLALGTLVRARRSGIRRPHTDPAPRAHPSAPEPGGGP